MSGGNGGHALAGIFLVFDPRGLPAHRREAFHRRVKALAGRLPGDRLESGDNEVAAVAAIHHGHFASGGVATAGPVLVAASGTCWRAGSEALESPAEMAAVDRAPGSDGAPERHGVFALARADAPTGTLVVQSDRFGAHAIYWRQHEGTTLVSSELRFLAEPGQDAPDVEVLAELLRFAFTPGDRTLIAGVHRLPAHHVLAAAAGGCRQLALPRLPGAHERPVDDGVVRELDGMVARGMRRHRLVPGSPGRGAYSVALSGGLDSRLVAGAALREGLSLRSFTAGEPDSLEVATAARVAEALGLPHERLLIDGASMPDWFAPAVWFTEGRTGIDHMHYLGPALSGALPAGPQLHGLIGEGIIGGYEERLHLLDATPAARLQASRDAIKDAIWWPAGRARQALAPPLADAMEASRERLLEAQQRKLWRTGSFAETVEFTFETVTVGFRVPNLVSQITPWTDVVSPFLDGEIMAFARTLAPEGLADRNLQIRWGLDCMPNFDAVPRLKDGVLIPVRAGIPHYYDEAIGRIWRRRRVHQIMCRLSGGRINPRETGSFPYFGQWYRRWPRVRRYIDGILLSEQSLDRGLWRREGVAALLGDLRHGREVWPAIGTILLSEMLLRQWCDGTDRPADLVTPLLAAASHAGPAGSGTENS